MVNVLVEVSKSWTRSWRGKSSIRCLRVVYRVRIDSKRWINIKRWRNKEEGRTEKCLFVAAIGLRKLLITRYAKFFLLILPFSFSAVSPPRTRIDTMSQLSSEDDDDLLLKDFRNSSHRFQQRLLEAQHETRDKHLEAELVRCHFCQSERSVYLAILWLDQSTITAAITAITRRRRRQWTW